MRTAIAVAGGAALIATIALVRQYAGTSSHTGTYTVYSTRAGQRATVSLRDGTRVTLNVASTLEVPRDFGAGRRNVHLVGEAMFDVAHHDDAPFVVDAAGVRTRVLGTTFGVRAYDGAVRVAVQSGRVAVTPCNATMFGEPCRGPGGNTVLNANDVAAVTPLGDVQVRHTTGVATELAFASGRLMFTGAPLHAVLGDLNRWYDVDVRVSDPAVANQALSGSLPQGTADDLVQALEVILGARVTRQGRVITVSAGTEHR
jgi:transmembrane sensor